MTNVRDREIENPVTGERIVFGAGMGDPDAPSLCFDFYLAPNGGVFVPHLHLGQQETLEIVRGQLACTLPDGERTVRAGERVTFAPRTGHTLRNTGSDELHARVEFRPAGRAEEFLRNYFGLCRDGHSDKTGELPLLHLAVFMPRYGNYRGDIPLLAQRFLFTLLRPVGWLLGYRATYPRYAARPSRGE